MLIKKQQQQQHLWNLYRTIKNICKDAGGGRGRGSVWGVTMDWSRLKQERINCDLFLDSIYFINIYTWLIPSRCDTTHWYLVAFVSITPCCGQVRLSCFRQWDPLWWNVIPLQGYHPTLAPRPLSQYSTCLLLCLVFTRERACQVKKGLCSWNNLLSFGVCQIFFNVFKISLQFLVSFSNIPTFQVLKLV